MQTKTKTKTKREIISETVNDICLRESQNFLIFFIPPIGELCPKGHHVGTSYKKMY